MRLVLSILLISFHEFSEGAGLRSLLAVNEDCSFMDKCHEKSFGADGSCAPTLINCDDSDPSTIDACDPDSGCKFVPIDAGLDSEEVFGENFYFYEDQPTISKDEALAVINWIKTEVTQLRTPFCWKRSYGRGVGKPLSRCPDHKEKIGALCYTPCPVSDFGPGPCACFFFR